MRLVNDKQSVNVESSGELLKTQDASVGMEVVDLVKFGRFLP